MSVTAFPSKKISLLPVQRVVVNLEKCKVMAGLPSSINSCMYVHVGIIINAY